MKHYLTYSITKIGQYQTKQVKSITVEENNYPENKIISDHSYLNEYKRCVGISFIRISYHEYNEWSNTTADEYRAMIIVIWYFRCIGLTADNIKEILSNHISRTRVINRVVDDIFSEEINDYYVKKYKKEEVFKILDRL